MRVTDEEIIEKYAEKLALLFNGGQWVQYTAEQKERWRARARAILNGKDIDV